MANRVHKIEVKMKIYTVPFHLGDWLGGTVGWDATECGAYWNLCTAHYLAGADGISADEVDLAKMARCSLKTWRRISPKILAKFTRREDVIVNSKVVEVILQIESKSSKNRDNALKRHNSDDAMAERTQCDGNASHKPINQSHNPAAIDGPVNSGDKSGRRGQQGNKNKKELVVSTHEQVDKALRGEPHYDPEASESIILPGGWDDHAQRVGVIDPERRFASWRKFKDLTAYPYERSRWVAWLQNEQSYTGEDD